MYHHKKSWKILIFSREPFNPLHFRQGRGRRRGRCGFKTRFYNITLCHSIPASALNCLLFSLPWFARCVNGSTLLHTASYFGCIPVIRQLVELGVDINLLDYKGATALHRAWDTETMGVSIFTNTLSCSAVCRSALGCSRNYPPGRMGCRHFLSCVGRVFCQQCVQGVEGVSDQSCSGVGGGV